MRDTPSYAGGDAAAAFAAAHRVWRQAFRIGRHTGVPMEPRSLVADSEPATRALTLWISSQVPHMLQDIAGGYKRAGEGGTAGAPAAILNAVNDALGPFGVRLTEQPLTPERVLRALGSAR